MKIHYSGGLRIVKNGGVSLRLRGWAACCTGDRAYKIAKDGNETLNPEDVTCKTCLKLMQDAGLKLTR